MAKLPNSNFLDANRCLPGHVFFWRGREAALGLALVG
jgi:hypothetical protein